MRKMRISISRVRDPVLYAAYKELGPRGFSIEAREILEAYANGQVKPAKRISHYQLYLSEADVCPYFYVGDMFYSLSQKFPFRARAEITRAVLSIAFVSGMTAIPQVKTNTPPPDTSMSQQAGLSVRPTDGIKDKAPLPQNIPEQQSMDGSASTAPEPETPDGAPEDEDDAMEDLASLFAGLDG